MCIIIIINNFLFFCAANWHRIVKTGGQLVGRCLSFWQPRHSSEIIVLWWRKYYHCMLKKNTTTTTTKRDICRGAIWRMKQNQTFLLCYINVTITFIFLFTNTKVTLQKFQSATQSHLSLVALFVHQHSQIFENLVDIGDIGLKQHTQTFTCLFTVGL